MSVWKEIVSVFYPDLDDKNKLYYRLFKYLIKKEKWKI